jgi:hypothetical protein
MSVEAIFKTSFDNEECLAEALRSLYGNDSIKVVTEGKEVKGFRSNKKPTIIINLPDMYGTAGFCKTADGTYEVVYDSTDRYKLSKLFPKKQGTITIDELKKAYSKAKVMNVIKAAHSTVVRNDVDEAGEVHIRLRTVQYGV